MSIERERRRFSPWRTIFYSVLASGIVCIAIVRFSEVQSSNSQADKSRKNCHLLQNVTMKLEEVAEDVSANAPSRDQRLRWEGYAEVFAASFPPGGPSCEDTFPKKKLIWFVAP